jgi:hypothetical protein
VDQIPWKKKLILMKLIKFGSLQSMTAQEGDSKEYRLYENCGKQEKHNGETEKTQKVSNSTNKQNSKEIHAFT